MHVLPEAVCGHSTARMKVRSQFVSHALCHMTWLCKWAYVPWMLPDTGCHGDSNSHGEQRKWVKRNKSMAPWRRHLAQHRMLLKGSWAIFESISDRIHECKKQPRLRSWPPTPTSLENDTTMEDITTIVKRNVRLKQWEKLNSWSRHFSYFPLQAVNSVTSSHIL